MKTFILSFEDANNRYEKQQLEIHAESFEKAAERGKKYEKTFIGLELKSITLK